MQSFIGVIMAFFGVIGMIGSAIAINFWVITIVIMSILKITGVVMIPWFAGLFTAGAISTGLFMLVGGLFMIFISMGVTFIGGILVES